MTEFITYVVIAFIGIAIIIAGNKSADEKCVKSGGIVITNSTDLNHSCVHTKGK